MNKTVNEKKSKLIESRRQNKEGFKKEVPCEREVEGYLKDRVKRLGGMCLKFTSPGCCGVPDRLVLFNGSAVFVELKAPGEKPRPLQIQIQREIERRGIRCEVLDSFEKVDWFIASLERARL